MKREDNMLIELRRMQTENVRLTNKLAAANEHIHFLEEENKTIAEETAEECEQKIRFANEEFEAAKKELALAIARAEKSEAERDEYKKKYEALMADREEIEEYKKIADAAQLSNADLNSIISLIQRRTYLTQSDASRFLDGVVNPRNPESENLSLEDQVKDVMSSITDGATTNHNSGATNDTKKKSAEKRNAKRKGHGGHEDKKRFGKRRDYSIPVLKEMGIDTSNLPVNAKIIRRKDKKTGEDVWFVSLITYMKPRLVCTKYKIGRFNVPGSDPMNSNYPECIIKRNPVTPSFARFYFDSKIAYNLSENRILEMLKSMRANLPQSSLNFWMHQIMGYLREKLEALMLMAIKKSFLTHNDETRILVRSRQNAKDAFKYNVEYIHSALSLEQKLVVMLYKNEGSRGHEVQEENILKGSDIKCIVADRAKLYETIVKNLEEFNIERAACWFHMRHYFVDAYISDHRMYDIIMLVNLLFRIERESMERRHTPEQRYRFRLKWSKPIVDKIMKKLEAIRKAGTEYGKLVHRAVNYVLEDKEAFLKFLQDGRIEMHNNAIERMFRHIAIGRRNWQHAGSHFAAENIAFMYSLYESCKLNNINFGEYIEDVLTRFMKGEEADMSFLPNQYVFKYNNAELDIIKSA